MDFALGSSWGGPTLSGGTESVNPSETHRSAAVNASAARRTRSA